MISLTEAAASEIRSALAQKRAQGFGLKVQVVGGGCEGFLYDLLYLEAPDASDDVFESQGVRLFVDRRALRVLDGLTIDHTRTPYGVGFVFKNPSARSQCSCGASFGT